MNFDEIGAQIMERGMGCCVLRVEVIEAEDGFTEPLTLPLWKSMHSVNLMLPKEDRKAMLLRLFNEEAELINHSDRHHGAGKDISKQSDTVVVVEDDAAEVEEHVQVGVDESNATVTNGLDQNRTRRHRGTSKSRRRKRTSKVTKEAEWRTGGSADIVAGN